tara:strand:+ start:12745 stop:15006 length:2262 start_codon:yes stop_codon:yes gene_type:complete
MLSLYDTMTKMVKLVNPITPGLVKIYSCGPTVYRDPHIGNYRSYLMSDWIRRCLEYQGIEVKAVKNITDVGHMRQEVLEQGEDKVIAAALAEGKTPRDIANFYTSRFMDDEKKLNIKPAHVFPKATDHINEMTKMVSRLLNQGHAYKSGGNVYFSVSSFQDYGSLSGNTNKVDLQEGVRVNIDPFKRDPRDFTLWKAAEPGRTVKWDSPWGEGFPGWHIECSAMSIKYLGEQFDIHTGGVDNIFPHHEDELAQSEAYTNKPLVNIWTHGQHLLCDGVKMSKSAGNSFILSDIESKGIDAIAFRYLCMTTRYNKRMNFSYKALLASDKSLKHLRNIIFNLRSISDDQNIPLDSSITITEDINNKSEEHIRNQWISSFINTVNNNLDMPGALKLTWLLLRATIPADTKYKIALEFDKILGLDLFNSTKAREVPKTITDLAVKRNTYRMSGNFSEGDDIRKKLNIQGYKIEDAIPVTHLEKNNIPSIRLRLIDKQNVSNTNKLFVSSSKEVDSYLDRKNEFDFTIGIVAQGYPKDVDRCLKSVLKWQSAFSIEIIALVNSAVRSEISSLDNVLSKYTDTRIIYSDYVLGSATAQNILMKQSLGKTIMLLDTSIEVTGDVYAAAESTLDYNNVGLFGPFGLRTNDLHHFHEGEGETGMMDAMQSYMLTFRRSSLNSVGFMRESFRFYRNLDIDYSFQFKNAGLEIFADHSLPVIRHTHRAWESLSENDRDELSRKNYGRFLRKWGTRKDLLVSNSRH